MKRKHPVLLVKSLRTERCERAVKDSQQSLRRAQQECALAARRVAEITVRIAALRQRQLTPAAGAADFQALDAQLKVFEHTLPKSMARHHDSKQRVQQARVEHARRVALWVAARESLRVAGERLAEIARIASAVADNAQDEEAAETRSVRAGGRTRPGQVHVAA